MRTDGNYRISSAPYFIIMYIGAENAFPERSRINFLEIFRDVIIKLRSPAFVRQKIVKQNALLFYFAIEILFLLC